MIVEHVVLPVRPGQEEAFEAAFAEAKASILASPGCLALSLARGVEQPSHYLMRVEWRSLDDHVTGFRGSPAYERWRSLLHHFYDPFPQVEHFVPVVTA
jgi:heme-degrading monooxygenase HmoA